MGKQSNKAKGARKLLHKWLKDRGVHFGHAPSNRELRDRVIGHPDVPADLKHILATSSNKTWKIAAIRYFEKTDPDFVKLAALPSKKTQRKMSFTKDPTKQNLKPVWKNFYASDEWRALRYAAFAAYGRKCGCCGASPETGAVMHVDHIKPRFTHPQLALELSNLQILCADCNKGKGAWDATDWRWKAEQDRLDAAFKNTIG
jgi:5-methylcytosine-specific restriction endonuclease McrA